MTTPQRSAEPRRPPIRQATTVRSDVEHTFTVFVREIGTWWPTPTISAGGDRVRAVTVRARDATTNGPPRRAPRRISAR